MWYNLNILVTHAHAWFDVVETCEEVVPQWMIDLHNGCSTTKHQIISPLALLYDYVGKFFSSDDTDVVSNFCRLNTCLSSDDSICFMDSPSVLVFCFNVFKKFMATAVFEHSESCSSVTSPRL